MPSHRTPLAALLLALPVAAAAQEAGQPGRVMPEAGSAAINEAIAGISEALAPSLSPGAPTALREVRVLVRPGILAQPSYDPAAERLVVDLVLDFAHFHEVDVPFPAAGFLLTPAARIVLDDVGVALSSPALVDERYLIAGHVAPSGDRGFDHWLSERRAAEARAYLVDVHGIAADRLLTAGFGATTPRRTGAGEGARSSRIEIVLVEAAGKPRALGPEAAAGNVVCDSRPVALVDPRPDRHRLDDFGSPRTPAECEDVHATRE